MERELSNLENPSLHIKLQTLLARPMYASTRRALRAPEFIARLRSSRTEVSSDKLVEFLGALEHVARKVA